MTLPPSAQALFDANPANAAVLDGSATVVAVNAAWRRFAAENGGPRHACVGMNYGDVCRGAANDRYASAALDGIRAVLAGEANAFEVEYPCDAPELPRWFLLRVAPYVVEGMRGAVTMHYDVTHPHRLAAALDKAQKMEAIGRMTAGVSHDLNNMLQVMVANLRMLERRTDATVRTQYVVPALRAAQQADDLTKRLLSFARSRGRSPRAIDPGEALHRAAPLLRQVLARGMHLTLDVPVNLPRVHVDPHRFEQALLNVAINARDAMDDGGTLAIRAGVREHDGTIAAPASLAPGRYVCVWLQDSGPGIPPELGERVFEPFFTTKLEDGTGLGLAMVREFAREAGGDAEIAPCDRGARVALWLPAVAAPDGGGLRPAHPDQRGGGAPWSRP